MTLTRLNWEPGEYETDQPWEKVNGLFQHVRSRHPSGLYGVGHEAGSLALFGRPHSFGPDGTPRTYTMASLSHVPFPGSAATRREVPAEASHGFQHWDVREVDPRELTATQESVRSDALSHYASGEAVRKGRLFDQTRDESNDHPVVVGLMRRKFILSGHHRATAALLNGEPLVARYRHIS